MDLILLSCSGSKRPGGIHKYNNEMLITSILQSNTIMKLNALRQQMATYIGEKQGPDIGTSLRGNDIEYMPAFQRYSGIVFKKSDFVHSYPKTKNLNVIIISAFYGILDAKEYIRDYNWQMGNKLPNGNHTKTWWKNNGLGEILLEIVDKLNPNRVYDFLFDKYRASIFPFYKGYDKRKIIRYESQQGFATLTYAGEELAKVFKKYY